MFHAILIFILILLLIYLMLNTYESFVSATPEEIPKVSTPIVPLTLQTKTASSNFAFSVPVINGPTA